MISASDFVRGLCTLPDGRAFPLALHQGRILRAAFTLDAEGRPPFGEVLLSTIKRSGKTTLGAAVALWAATQIEPAGEVLLLAADQDASKSRAFKIVGGMIDRHPGLRAEVRRRTGTEITLRSGSVIRAVAADAKGIAGSDMILAHADELWSFDQSALQELWNETTPILSRAFSVRLSTSYAGYSNRPGVLRRLWDLGLAGERLLEDLPVWANRDAGLLAYVDQGEAARRFPWQVGPRAVAYYRGQAQTLSPGAYLRLHENEWATGEEDFIGAADLAAVTDADRLPPRERVQLFCHLDASVSNDWTALVGVYWQGERVVLGPVTVWKPSKAQPISFAEVEAELLVWRDRFDLAAVGFDPYQAVGLAQRLTAAGVPMVEVAQTASNQTAATTALRHAISDRRLVLWPHEDVRRCLLNAVLDERAGSLKLAKPSPGAKIDAAVSLAFAVLAAERAGAVPFCGEGLLGKTREAAAVLAPELFHLDEMLGRRAESRRTLGL